MIESPTMLWNILIPVLSSAGSAILTMIALYFFKPWAKAYAETAAILTARDERLDKILKEVEAVTRTQEQIKSELSGHLWNRQMHWNQKRDIYGNLIKAATDLRSSHGMLPKLAMLVDEATEEKSKLRFKRAFNKALANVNSSRDDLNRAAALAHIFASDECNSALSKHSLAHERLVLPIQTEWVNRQVEADTLLRIELLKAAKSDLLLR